jgi:site-specific recombinase XerD
MSSNIDLMVHVHQVTVMNAIQSFMRIALAGKSPQTKKWYSYRLDLMARHLGETRPLIDILEVDLIRYRETLEARKISPDTFHGYLRAARRLFKWLYKRGIMLANIAEDIELPKPPRRGKKGIADNHVALILEEAKHHSTRDYSILTFLESTNARRGGVATLQMSAINLDEKEPKCRQASVIEKGNKQRTVIMSDETMHALRAWLDVRKSSSPYVFVSESGKPLNPDSVSEIVDRYKKRLHIKAPCSPHQWRHRWFRRMISNGMPLAQAAQLGGHESTNVTYQFYGQFALDDLQTAYDRYYKP